jgi:hypothetical protein
MRRHVIRRGLIAVALLAGCATQQQILDQGQPKAVETALARARFDLNCPTATGTVLSREMIQPAVPIGQPRAEYTVGVSGCDKRTSVTVICPQGGDNCFAAGGRFGPGER